MGYLHSFAALTFLFCAVISGTAGAQTVTIEKAIGLVLARNPRIAAHKSRVDAADFGVTQAGAYPNPEIGLGAENLGRSEFEIGLSQKFRLGGKRAAVRETARSEKALTEAEYELLVLELTAETYRRYLPIVALRRKQDVIDSLMDTAARTLETIKERHAAGAGLAVDTIRAHIALRKLSAAALGLEADLRIHNRSLVALWNGEGSDSLNIVADDMTELHTRQREFYLSKAARHPVMQLREKEAARIRSEIALKKAEAVPDLSISAGFKRNNERNENASILYLSGDIPVFNRNSDAVESRRRSLAAQNHEKEGELLERELEIKNVYDRLESKREILAIEKDIVEESHAAYELMRDHYSRGVIGFLSVSESLMDLLDHLNESIDLQLEQELLVVELCLLSNSCFRVD